MIFTAASPDFLPPRSPSRQIRHGEESLAHSRSLCDPSATALLFMAALRAGGRPGCVYALDWSLDTNKRSTSAAQLLPVAHQAVRPMMLLLAPGQTNTQRPGEVMLHLNHHSQPDRLRKTVLVRRQFHGTQEETLINPPVNVGSHH